MKKIMLSRRCRRDRSCGGFGRRVRAAVGALSRGADTARRRRAAGRQRRHARARAGEAARDAAAASDRDRQPRRRERHPRLRHRREGAAGRLHAAQHGVPARGEPEPLQIAAVRHREGFRADHQLRERRGLPARDQSVGAGEIGEGADRATRRARPRRCASARRASATASTSRPSSSRSRRASSSCTCRTKAAARR